MFIHNKNVILICGATEKVITIGKKALGGSVILLALWVGFKSLDYSFLLEVFGRIDFVHMMLASVAIIGVMVISTSQF